MSSLQLFFLAGARKHSFDPGKDKIIIIKKRIKKSGTKEELDGQRLENHGAKGRITSYI